MTTKFTKGPWSQCFANGIIIQTESTGYGICKVIGNLESDKANAALIACAPEMYELLDEISDGLLEAGGFGNCALAKRIESLLAKARGES